MKTTLLRLVLALGVLTGATVTAMGAESLASIRARMEKRLPRIDALKASGALGENNRGLLEVRSDGGDASAAAAEENRDRQAVYAELARQTNSSAEQVGRARARQIAANSARGVWLQRENGEWYRK